MKKLKQEKKEKNKIVRERVEERYKELSEQTKKMEQYFDSDKEDGEDGEDGQ
jgi:hypothetical protein